MYAFPVAVVAPSIIAISYKILIGPIRIQLLKPRFPPFENAREAEYKCQLKLG